MASREVDSSSSWLGGFLATAGILLIVVGFAWPYVLPQEMVWSEEDALQLNEAQEAAHAASIGHDHSLPHTHAHDEEKAARLSESRERYQELASELEKARSLQQMGGRYLMTVGTVAALGGLLILRRSSAE
jgi:hypothetical protein